MHNDDIMRNIKEVKMPNVNTYKEIMLYMLYALPSDLALQDF